MDPSHFSVGYGADRTVLTAAVLSSLALQSETADEPIGGLGGVVDSTIVETRIQFIRETGSPVSFRGRFAAVTGASVLDISVLGRDITDNFAVIVDRLQGAVYLLGQRHTYDIKLL